MATNISTPLLESEEAVSSTGGGQTIMTEFVIAITAFCSLILISCMAIVVLLVHFKRIHRDDEEYDDDEFGTYTGDEESTVESNPSQQQQYGQKRWHQPRSDLVKQHHKQKQQRDSYGQHKNHVLSMRDAYETYHIREQTIAEKFWRAEAIRNPMHRGPEIIF